MENQKEVLNRMEVELTQLLTKLGKLKTFLDSSKSKNLTNQDKVLLEEQQHYMIKYKEILQMRINIMENKIKNN